LMFKKDIYFNLKMKENLMSENATVINNNPTTIFTPHEFFIQGKKVRAFFPKPKADDEKIISRVQDMLISNYMNSGKITNNIKIS